MMTRLTAWPRTLRAGTRLYRRTPVVLRRPEPWVRLVGVLFVLWFGGMFLALGVLGRRGAATAATQPVAFHAYFVAAALGALGLSLLLTRRYRLGLGLMAGMLAVGQLATLAVVV